MYGDDDDHKASTKSPQIVQKRIFQKFAVIPIYWIEQKHNFAIAWEGGLRFSYTPPQNDFSNPFGIFW